MTEPCGYSSNFQTLQNNVQSKTDFVHIISQKKSFETNTPLHVYHQNLLANPEAGQYYQILQT